MPLFYEGKQADNIYEFQKQKNQALEQQTAEMQTYLTSLQNSGVKLYVDGILSTPSFVVQYCMVCENSGYMGDYITDERGILNEIRYNKVEKQG